MPLFTRKIFDQLTSKQLHEELDAERIAEGLRWTSDIAYQKEVAKRVEALVNEENYQVPAGFSKAEVYQRLATGYCEAGENEKVIKYAGLALENIESEPDETKRHEIKARAYGVLGVKDLQPTGEQKLDYFAKGFAECEFFKANTRVYARTKSFLYRNQGLAYLVACEHALKNKNTELAVELLKHSAQSFNDAIEMIEQCEAIHAAMPPVLTYRGLISVRLYEITKDEDELEIGKDYLEEAHAEYETLDVEAMRKDCQDYGSFAAHLAKRYLVCEQYRDAIVAYNVCYEIRKELKGADRSKLCDVHIGKGRAYLGWGVLDKAEAHFKEAKTILNELEKNDEVKVASVTEFLNKIAALRIPKSPRLHSHSSREVVDVVPGLGERPRI